MEISEFYSGSIAKVGGLELWLFRRQSAMKITSMLKDVGVSMSGQHDLNEDQGKAIRAMGSILQMCGELGLASAKMLSEKEHYAGAALLRQIVEIEHLTWTFEKGKSDIISWLEMTDKERMKLFSPAQLRKNSHGRFLNRDYKMHCQLGGHPVPNGIRLLNGGLNVESQVFIVDLLMHCWRTWDQVRLWLIKQEYELSSQAKEISKYLFHWGGNDPMYKYICVEMPEEQST